ncbi:hypothetical protein [Nocardia asiatica]|uniref:hypothetical protein n=1 Tax=Nocardia asiatica TaxID=209252 RepID=UPI002453922F|nr:hypothetical protein [Nocardia asiatica]
MSRAEAEKARKLGRALEQQARGVQREMHNVAELIRQQQQRQQNAKARVQEAVQRAIQRQEAQKAAETARQQQLARIIEARAQLLAKLPPEVARILDVSMLPPAEELDLRPPTPGTGTTRAGREARAQARENYREARGLDPNQRGRRVERVRGHARGPGDPSVASAAVRSQACHSGIRLSAVLPADQRRR